MLEISSQFDLRDLLRRFEAVLVTLNILKIISWFPVFYHIPPCQFISKMTKTMAALQFMKIISLRNWSQNLTTLSCWWVLWEYFPRSYLVHCSVFSQELQLPQIQNQACWKNIVCISPSSYILIDFENSVRAGDDLSEELLESHILDPKITRSTLQYLLYFFWYVSLWQIDRDQGLHICGKV